MRTAATDHCRAAAELIRAGRPARAAALLNLRVRRDPRDGAALAWRGLARFAAAEYEAAVEDLDMALALDAESFSWLLPAREAGGKACGRPAPAPHSFGAAPGREAAAGEWLPWLARMAALNDVAERVTVRDGARRILFRNVEDGDPFPERARAEGLTVTPLFRVRAFSGFSHYHDLLPPDAPGGLSHVVAARDPRDAEEAATLYARGLRAEDHDRLGELLGFPRCCRRAFARRFVRGGVCDPLYESAAAARGARLGRRGRLLWAAAAGHPECNALARYFGLRAASWLPCAADCAETRRRARLWLDAARPSDPEASERLEEFLSLPMTWRGEGSRARLEVPAAGLAGQSASAFPQGPREVRWRPLSTAEDPRPQRPGSRAPRR